MTEVIAQMSSYDLKGNKLSFANWISNLSPTETPFSSMTGKESIQSTKFHWQTDTIPAVDKDNAKVEGSVPTESTVTATTVLHNYTQIFRREAPVSDSAKAEDNYGRGDELAYQMEKAGIALKRDIESLLLNNGAASGMGSVSRKTAGFSALVAAKDAVDPDTKAVVHKETTANDVMTEKELFDLTYNLYLAGSKANTIMFHPKHAVFFASLPEAPGDTEARVKMFSGLDDKYNRYVKTVIDHLGQQYALVPNRYMPEDQIFIFNPSDWTQMILRAPKRIELGKKGSYTHIMVEAELGLRHRNPYASGILKIKKAE